MNYLIDTNVCIALMNGRPQQVRRRLTAAWLREDKVFLSCIVLHELFYGAAKSTREDQNIRIIENLLLERLEILPLDYEAAKASGQIRAQLESEGKRIGDYDTLIAGQAYCTSMTLVTANTREFIRIQGLKLEDWTQQGGT